MFYSYELEVLFGAVLCTFLSGFLSWHWLLQCNCWSFPFFSVQMGKINKVLLASYLRFNTTPKQIKPRIQQSESATHMLLSSFWLSRTVCCVVCLQRQTGGVAVGPQTQQGVVHPQQQYYPSQPLYPEHIPLQEVPNGHDMCPTGKKWTVWPQTWHMILEVEEKSIFSQGRYLQV